MIRQVVVKVDDELEEHPRLVARVLAVAGCGRVRTLVRVQRPGLGPGGPTVVPLPVKSRHDYNGGVPHGSRLQKHG